MLTSKERAELRAQANPIETTLMVGKSGVTEAVIAEAENLLTARELVKGKVLEGALLSPREVSVDFIARNTAADGVLSTKANLTKRAKELGLVAIQRFFLLDSMAIRNIEKHLGPDVSDLIEVLPGLMPKVIRQVRALSGKPVVAGGLITDKEDVTGALGAGAVAVSAPNPAVWEM